jgi:antitoxin component YwqK of YwqJK toxin-antitoxin module
MGYSTYHKLSTKGATEKQNEKLLQMFQDGYDEYDKDWDWTVAEFNGEDIGESAKWYDSDQDMKELSSREEYKDVLFILEGEGEENDDIWKAYYKNGKVQKEYARITFDEFDESKLN